VNTKPANPASAAEPPADGLGRWPARVRPGALRFARASTHYQETVAFYRDLVGLPLLGEFAASYGADGTIFGLPDTSIQLEVVRARAASDASHGGGSDQIVLYLDDSAAVSAATAPLGAAGLTPDPEPHAYWAANGAVTYRDPDGRVVIFAPWVFGRDPEPVDRDGQRDATEPTRGAVRIDWYDGDRAALRSLFEEAEDSPTQLAAYGGAGRVLVASDGAAILGHLQVVPTGRSDEVELKSMAVVRERRGEGLGRLLVDAALRWAAAEGLARMVVATAAADIGNLRFYQRCGFRLTAVEPDAFGPASGYPDPIVIDGIPLRDRVWLAQDLTP
jgi:GNAT superfamily N-acetyltransferase